MTKVIKRHISGSLKVKKVVNKKNINVQGRVSRSLLWNGPPLVKEGHLYSFRKATFKFSFTKPPLTLLTKGLPLNLRREQMFFKGSTHSLKDTLKVPFQEGGFVKLRFFKGGRNSRKSLNSRWPFSLCEGKGQKVICSNALKMYSRLKNFIYMLVLKVLIF